MWSYFCTEIAYAILVHLLFSNEYISVDRCLIEIAGWACDLHSFLLNWDRGLNMWPQFIFIELKSQVQHAISVWLSLIWKKISELISCLQDMISLTKRDRMFKLWSLDGTDRNILPETVF